jgi:hypothetical protein
MVPQVRQERPPSEVGEDLPETPPDTAKTEGSEEDNASEISQTSVGGHKRSCPHGRLLVERNGRRVFVRVLAEGEQAIDQQGLEDLLDAKEEDAVFAAEKARLEAKHAQEERAKAKALKRKKDRERLERKAEADLQVSTWGPKGDGQASPPSSPGAILRELQRGVLTAKEEGLQPGAMKQHAQGSPQPRDSSPSTVGPEAERNQREKEGAGTEEGVETSHSVVLPTNA